VSLRYDGAVAGDTQPPRKRTHTHARDTPRRGSTRPRVRAVAAARALLARTAAASGPSALATARAAARSALCRVAAASPPPRAAAACALSAPALSLPCLCLAHPRTAPRLPTTTTNLSIPSRPDQRAKPTLAAVVFLARPSEAARTSNERREKAPVVYGRAVRKLRQRVFGVGERASSLYSLPLRALLLLEISTCARSIIGLLLGCCCCCCCAWWWYR